VNCKCGGWQFYTVRDGKLAVQCIACKAVTDPPKLTVSDKLRHMGFAP